MRPKTHLNLHGPANATALLDGLVQIPLGEIRVFTASDGSFVHVEVLDGLVQKPVVLLNCTRKIGISDDNLDKMGCKGSGLTLMKVLLPSALTHRNCYTAPVTNPIVSPSYSSLEDVFWSKRYSQCGLRKR